jgi:hypothetical protein
MDAPSFRRNRKPGISQAAIERAIRAARAADPSAVVEIDPITKVIRVLNGAIASKAAPAKNPWDEVLTDAADKERPA